MHATRTFVTWCPIRELSSGSPRFVVVWILIFLLCYFIIIFSLFVFCQRTRLGQLNEIPGTNSRREYRVTARPGLQAGGGCHDDVAECGAKGRDISK